MDNQRYNQLIADLRTDYRPQREWGDGRGILMVLGHFLVGVAGGTWALASIQGEVAGLVVAYVLGCLGALMHLMFLGRPERALNMLRHVRTSWISRGFAGLALFLVGGGIYLMTLLGGGAWGLVGQASNFVAALGTITIVGYMGFCYTASKAIPFWHSPLHPAIYIAFAGRGGIAALLVIGAVKGAAPDSWLLESWIGVTVTVCLFFALEIHGSLSGGNIAAKWAARDMITGRLALMFYAGTLATGLIVPVALLLGSATHTPVMMATVGLASAAGDFFMKLSTVRAGVYLPLHISTRHRA